MNDPGIFMISGGSTVVLKRELYESEELLQILLASFPEVLAGSTTSDESRSLLLIARELGVPSAEAAGATWSLDHLFVDTEAVPVIVEVKRSTDTRIRREVIGQMLDYAANGVRYWPVADLQDSFDKRAQEQGVSGEQVLQEAIPGIDVEDFWARVEGNLRSGRVRMVFVADSLPDELVRIIEFLNEQMNPAEVIGVEVPQYVGGGQQVLVPRVVGRTSSARVAKHASGGSTWTESTFMAAANEHCTPGEAQFLADLFEDVRDHGHHFSWGKGVSPGVSGWYVVGDAPTPVFTASLGLGSTGAKPYIYWYAPNINQQLSDEEMAAFVSLLSVIPTYQVKYAEAATNNYASKYPSAPIAEITADDQRRSSIFAALTYLRGLPSPTASVGPPSA